MLAPAATASYIAFWATIVDNRSPGEPPNEYSPQLHMTPDTPMPLLPAAHAVPATAVPCSLRSPTTKPPTVTMLGVRSGCRLSTWRSTRATFTALDPVVVSHAVGASMYFRAQLFPTLGSVVQESQAGSLGTVCVASIRS